MLPSCAVVSCADLSASRWSCVPATPSPHPLHPCIEQSSLTVCGCPGDGSLGSLLCGAAPISFSLPVSFSRPLFWSLYRRRLGRVLLLGRPLDLLSLSLLGPSCLASFSPLPLAVSLRSQYHSVGVGCGHVPSGARSARSLSSLTHLVYNQRMDTTTRPTTYSARERRKTEQSKKGS